MNAEHLVTMANQIGAFFRSQGTHQQAIDGIADHLKRFWEPRMLRAIEAHVAAGAEGMEGNVIEAVRQLQHRPGA
jgi:formate dehydrogenase subunit delta